MALPLAMDSHLGTAETEPEARRRSQGRPARGATDELRRDPGRDPAPRRIRHRAPIPESPARDQGPSRTDTSTERSRRLRQHESLRTGGLRGASVGRRIVLSVDTRDYLLGPGRYRARLRYVASRALHPGKEPTVERRRADEVRSDVGRDRRIELGLVHCEPGGCRRGARELAGRLDVLPIDRPSHRNGRRSAELSGVLGLGRPPGGRGAPRAVQQSSAPLESSSALHQPACAKRAPVRGSTVWHAGCSSPGS